MILPFFQKLEFLGSYNHHKIDSKLRIIKSGSNQGKKFYGGSLWLVSRKFFVFVEIRASLSVDFVLIWEKFCFL